MTCRADRRTVLLLIGTAAVATVAGTAPAQAGDISGTVEFEGGALIPKGEIAIHIEDATYQEDAPPRAAGMRVRSDGKSKSVGFSFPPSMASPEARIVARLERADGWLLARGSARLEVGSAVTLVLRTVMY